MVFAMNKWYIQFLVKKKILVALMLCVLLLFIGGCGQSKNYKQVVIDALFTKNQLVLNLPNESSGPRRSFQLGYSLDHETLLGALPDGAQCRQLKSGWLISTENDNGTKNQFYLYNIPNPEVDWYGYEITQMSVTLETLDLFDLTMLLFPVHYLVKLESHLFVDTDYEIEATLEELIAFYQDSGWYDFEIKESSLVLNGYRYQPEWGSEGDGSVSLPVYQYSHLVMDDAFPMIIHYREEDSKRFIQIEYGGRELTQEEKYPEGRPTPTQKPAESF